MPRGPWFARGTSNHTPRSRCTRALAPPTPPRASSLSTPPTAGSASSPPGTNSGAAWRKAGWSARRSSATRLNGTRPVREKQTPASRRTARRDCELWLTSAPRRHASAEGGCPESRGGRGVELVDAQVSLAGQGITWARPIEDGGATRSRTAEPPSCPRDAQRCLSGRAPPLRRRVADVLLAEPRCTRASSSVSEAVQRLRAWRRAADDPAIESSEEAIDLLGGRHQVRDRDGRVLP